MLLRKVTEFFLLCRRTRAIARLFPSLLLLLVLLGGCRLVGDESVELPQVYSEIGAAIDYKEKECGQKPEYPLIIPGRPSQYGTRLCSMSIIRQECPFHDYPLFCLEMYTEECDPCDLPMIGP